MLTVAAVAQRERMQWDAFVAAQPHGHLLQSFAWGELKAGFGWEPLRVALMEGDSIRAAAQVLFRRFLGVSLAYVPRGPVLDWEDEAASRLLLQAILEAGRARRAVFLKIEPNVPDSPSFATRLSLLGFRPARTVQPRNTLVLDLTRSEEDLLAKMRKHTRYGIHLAERQAVRVRPVANREEVVFFYSLLRGTASRRGFRIHALPYYQQFYDLFNEPGQAALLFAEREGVLLAALWAVAFGPEAIYMYAASLGRAYMAPALLLWHAVLWSRARGCVRYDLWGIPEEAVAGGELLPTTQRRALDPLWGVYIFKRGFRGSLFRTVGAYDLACQPLLYRVYRAVVERRRRLT